MKAEASSQQNPDFFSDSSGSINSLNELPLIIPIGGDGTSLEVQSDFIVPDDGQLSAEAPLDYDRSGPCTFGTCPKQNC